MDRRVALTGIAGHNLLRLTPLDIRQRLMERK
jgi:hypothetical protein